MSINGVSKLDVSVIEKVHTGQIVFNIAAACKELIENALDAGATSIGKCNFYIYKVKSTFRLIGIFRLP